MYIELYSCIPLFTSNIMLHSKSGLGIYSLLKNPNAKMIKNLLRKSQICLSLPFAYLDHSPTFTLPCQNAYLDISPSHVSGQTLGGD